MMIFLGGILHIFCFLLLKSQSALDVQTCELPVVYDRIKTHVQRMGSEMLREPGDLSLVESWERNSRNRHRLNL